MRASSKASAIAAIAIVAIMVLSYAAYYIGRPRPRIEPPSPELLSSYVGEGWALNSSRSFIATFKAGSEEAFLTFLNGSTTTYNLSQTVQRGGLVTYRAEFEMPGPNGKPDGGLPRWVRVYTFTGPDGSYLVVEVFSANSTQLDWTLESLESKFGPPSEFDGVKYYAEMPYAPLLKIIYVYAIYKEYLVVVSTNASVPESSVAALAVNYALSLP
ncbi:MAG: hypothetical protein ACP5FT_01870 [Acidilobus sp.]